MGRDPSTTSGRPTNAQLGGGAWLGQILDASSVIDVTLPVTLLRPEDRLNELVIPPSTGNPIRGFSGMTDYEMQWKDAFLGQCGSRYFDHRGIRPGKLPATFGDYVRAWGGLDFEALEAQPAGARAFPCSRTFRVTVLVLLLAFLIVIGLRAIE